MLTTETISGFLYPKSDQITSNWRSEIGSSGTDMYQHYASA